MSWSAPLAALALLAGCGAGEGDRSDSGQAVQAVDAHGEPSPAAREHVRDAAEEFLLALASRDADAFCELALPELQRPNFEDAHAPAGDCEERARAMFDADFDDGEEPAWQLLSQGTVGAIRLRCARGPDACGRATVRIGDLPLRGGGTTSAPTPVSFAGGRWRIGEYWVAVEDEPPAIQRQDPVAAAQGYLDSLTEQDPGAFCELTLPAARNAAFSASGAPSTGSCQERAQAMFDAPADAGSPPLWAREGRAVLGQINLHCIPGTERCRRAKIRVESLPLACGGTTIAPMTIVRARGRWLVGPVSASGRPRSCGCC